MKKIVIVGAGYSGILTAKKLAKRLKKNSDVSITIIDKNPFHTMLTELHEVAANRVEEDSIRISLKKIFSGRKVDVKLDTVTSIDYNKKTVIGTIESYSYDYLILSAGSKPNFYGVGGANEYSFKLWSYQDAITLRDHIHDCFRKAACETDVAKKRKLLTFCAVGAGFTGVEMIGELAEYVPFLCEKYDVDRKDITLCNIDALPRPIPNLPEKLSAKVVKRLEKMGVRLILNAMVNSIGEDHIEYTENSEVVRQEANTVIWAAGIQSADVTQASGDALELTNGGRVQVDSHLRSSKEKQVYIAGDNMYYIPEGEEKPVPQMVENCEQCAAVIAHNIVCDITGQGSVKEYKPSFHGVMVSIGGRYGVAYVGLPNRMFSLPSFLAMFVKHFINIIYFIQVLGWNKVFSYIKHEFFTVRNCRSFVGGHFSNRTPSFLLVPLRVWLGAVWIFEGVMKILEGWFTSPKLNGFFGGATAWYNSILGITTTAAEGADAVSSATTAAEATPVADAVTGATGAVADAAGAAAEAIGEVILNFNFLGLFKVIFVSGKELAHSTLSDFAFRLDVPFMNWFLDKFILTNDGAQIQIAMQAFIVIAEILVGLALLGGLFTTPAAAFSLVLQFMFVCTTGLYLGTFWMIFAGVALLIGAGRTLGLDYYAMPKLKKMWKRLPLIRKLYIYND